MVKYNQNYFIKQHYYNIKLIHIFKTIMEVYFTLLIIFNKIWINSLIIF